MKIKTLEGVATKDILEVFNTAFYDYFIPFQLTEEQLATKLIADKIHLDISVGVFVKKHLIAFILHGLDKIDNENVVYNAGTGVIPNKRGSGLTKQMYRFILPILKEKAIHNLVLEVISENVQAILSYTSSGFKIERELVCYKGALNPITANNSIQIKSLRHHNWDKMESFWDITPTWQNSKNSINELRNDLISLGAYFQNKFVGYIVYDPKNKRILQLAVSKEFRRNKIASSLILKLTKKYGPTMSIINVDKTSTATHQFLEKMGFEKYLEQLEMKLKLAALPLVCD